MGIFDALKDLDPDTLAEMNQAFDAIQMSRTPFALQNFVVGARFTEPQRYAQCVLEMSNAYDQLRLARLNEQKKLLEIQKLPDTDEGKLDRQIKEIELEQLRRAALGTLREFQSLFGMWKAFNRNYTREELNQDSEIEYKHRLLTQAEHDFLTLGTIAQGNLEGLRQAHLPLPPPPVAIQEQARRIAATEQRYLSQGRCRILIGVPTEKRASNGLPCLEGLQVPAGKEVGLFNNYGNPTADAYNFIVREAQLREADYLLTVEDDTFPPPDALLRLFALVTSRPNIAAGAWYPKREVPRQGVHIVLGKNERSPLVDDGEIHEVYTLAMGCTLYPMSIFKVTPYPWFVSTPQVTQDSFFSQLAREAGWTLLVDTSIRCRHIDRATGKVYE